MTDLAVLIDQLRSSRLAAYRVARGDIREHSGIEETVLAGGYGYRQVLELVQNGADAILEANEQLIAYASLPILDRLQWLDEVRRFTLMVRDAPTVDLQGRRRQDADH